MTQVFHSLEDGMLVLEQGYQDAKQLEGQILKQMQLQN
jgi:hypothetical protein